MPRVANGSRGSDADQRLLPARTPSARRPSRGALPHRASRPRRTRWMPDLPGPRSRRGSVAGGEHPVMAHARLLWGGLSCVSATSGTRSIVVRWRLGAHGDLRLSDLLAEFSVATDLGMGQPPEKAVRSCLMATGLRARHKMRVRCYRVLTALVGSGAIGPRWAGLAS